MPINFFELKYLILDSFYLESSQNGYIYEQSSGICYESFAEYVNSDKLEAIISISTIIRLKLRHGLQLTQYDMLNIKKILCLYSTLGVKDFLNESELEYLEEDIAVIEYKYKEIEKR
ncbi:MAG: hypothetical protein HDT39_09290 [Lachnospiraceae bacterium]|nr:hypothetical protein [Lachnospiraceae bacterium]